MDILLTNDDGVFAPGIRSLYDELSREHNLTIIAPESEQSAVGHAITLLKPLRIKSVSLSGGVDAFAVDGTPADCIKIGVKQALRREPDLIISGINVGANVGVDALYSGTVSAATEGAILGIPSMAVSLDTFYDPDFGPAARIAALLADRIGRNGLRKGVALNINVPNLPFGKIGGLAVTRHGSSRYLEEFEQRVDPRGNTYYWQSGNILIRDPREDTDRRALEAGMVSITPIHSDLTHYEALDEVRSWVKHMRTM